MKGLITKMSVKTTFKHISRQSSRIECGRLFHAARPATEKAFASVGEMAADVLGMAFIPYYRHIMHILESDKNLKQTIQGIMKQVCWSATGTVVGGVVGGPLGAAVGGVVGTVIGYTRSDDYDSLLTVLRNMNDQQKKHLVEKVQQLVGSTGIEALTQFVGSQVNRELFATLIREFATELKTGG